MTICFPPHFERAPIQTQPKVPPADRLTPTLPPDLAPTRENAELPSEDPTHFDTADQSFTLSPKPQASLPQPDV